MRALKRNKRPFWVAVYTGAEDVTDAQDRLTGEKRLVYDVPKLAYGNISASSGSTINRATANVVQRAYGETVDYDRVIVMDDLDFVVNEASVVWIDPPVNPKLNNDGTFNTPYQYVITRIAKTLNVLSLTLREVTVRA